MSKNSTANERQIGGAHYAGSYQHWDFIRDVGLGYHAGNASKYLSRYASKNGKQDLEKALHYIDKCKELGLKGVEPDDLAARLDRASILGRFVASSGMGVRAFAAHEHMMNGSWGLASSNVQKLIEETYPEPDPQPIIYPEDEEVEELAPDLVPYEYSTRSNTKPSY